MQISRYYFLTLASALCLSSAVACKTAPPQELVDAREQYRRVAAGPAAQKAPAHLDNARIALARAEKAFEEDPADAQTRDYAYIAQRKAQLADAKSGIEVASERKINAAKELSTTTKDKLAEAKDDLKDSRQETQDSKVNLAASEQKNLNSQEQLAASEQKNVTSQEQLAAEKVEHQATQDQNKELIASLTNMATVKEEVRGTVISLSGGVLFASGKSTLLSTALTALDSVAAALNKNTQSITIEGHTDSVGTDSFNQRLSRDRAEAVRSYLISRGIEISRIDAIGFGSSRPVTENQTADGRANNRRVEIIILKKAT